MKSVLKTTAALVAVLALTATAEAALTKARSAKASKGTKVAAVKKSVKNPEVSDVSAASSGVQFTETARLEEVKPAVQAKRWSLSAYSEVYGATMSQVSDGTLGKKGADGKAQGTLTADNGIIAGFKFADTLTASAAFEWGQDFGTRDADTKTTMYDPSVRLSRSDLATFGDTKVSGQARLYFPVSEASIDKEQIAQIRFYATASRDISKALSASFTLNPRIFIQQNDTYINAEGERKMNMDRFRLLSSAAMKYSFNSMLAVEQTFGLYQKWRTNADRKDFLDASTSVYFTPVSWLELNLGIRQIDESTDTRKTGLSGLYNDEQTEYYLITSISI